MTAREELVAQARDTISKGSQSFKSASKLFAPATRERAWLLYAWCRSLDDETDGQQLGHAGVQPADPAATQARLGALTAAALDSDDPVPPAFAALRQVARETGMPRTMIEDHLTGFALDAQQWRPQSEDDLLRYCYHVAGSVGCMMAVVMGVDPRDEDTLNRACDLGLAFQLANIARDIVPDALVGRCYLPADWLAEAGIDEAGIADPANLPAIAAIARRLVTLARALSRFGPDRCGAAGRALAARGAGRRCDLWRNRRACGHAGRAGMGPAGFDQQGGQGRAVSPGHGQRAGFAPLRSRAQGCGRVSPRRARDHAARPLRKRAAALSASQPAARR